MNEFKGDDLYFGDALELYTKALRPKCVDLICTDLPYGTTACKWDTIIPFDKLWEMVDYLLRPNGTFITTASQPFTSALVMSNPKQFKFAWVWNKKFNSNFALKNYQPQKIHEDILVFSNGVSLFNGQKTKRDKPIKHGANKCKSESSRVALMEYLIKTYSNEWDFVLDPFAGSATTLIAAQNTNRYFIGFEKDEGIYKRAKNRLDEHIKSKQV